VGDVNKVKIFLITAIIMVAFGIANASSKKCNEILVSQTSSSQKAEFEKSIKALEMNSASAHHTIALVNERLRPYVQAVMVNTEIDLLKNAAITVYNRRFGGEVTSLVTKKEIEAALLLSVENLEVLLSHRGFRLNSEFSQQFQDALSDSAVELFFIYRENAMLNARMISIALH
jgi:cell division protein FtsL